MESVERRKPYNPIQRNTTRTIVVMVLFSQYLREVDVPGVKYSQGRLKWSKLPLLKLFPILLTILLMWGLCAILTVTEAIGPENSARTDTKLALVRNSAWFRFPYPFQWGVPTVTAAGVFGMSAGVLASAIESVGDYYACARLSGAPRPPTHAINRGIGTEGFGCVLAGLWGTGNGTTSYSENIGAIGVTKVGSRRVIQCGGLIMILFGLLSKFGAFFLTIPSPIVGGIFCVMFGMITAVGLSNLQFVDLNSSRNLFVLGFPIFFSLMLPEWVKKNDENLEFTGNSELDQIIKVLLSTHMFVGGVLGFFLDNTVPGTREERGLVAWEDQHDGEDSAGAQSKTDRCYDLPVGMVWLRKQKWAEYVPFLPTFQEKKLSMTRPKWCKRRNGKWNCRVKK
ncbi:solute carrier family 23 member 2 isoform X2 [Eurytemora carolleeae]|uniref:solute carrier family 23 member 2 isoform X2 n=1 Tax=Eurytemora carolleeae TaxID=1294199 RepID=UPI000C76737B|nr:solute carrier family 23 member 2 isoform X2 [Eurytemora carolleeae]|eukprot:XP_023345185.1 solute carrier family 23 member 2-like isoform X2 [Eurytemora affinis]